MGSELDSGGGLDGERCAEIRGVGLLLRAEGVGVGGGVACDDPIVSPPRVGSSPNMVDALSISTGAPQDEQKRTLEDSCAPHEEQNMEARFYHSCLHGLPPRPAISSIYEEERSTCTAVP